MSAPRPAGERHPVLPHALPGERRELASRAGRLSYYASTSTGAPTSPVATRSTQATSPGEPHAAPPVLLLHSMNAAGSAYEVRPLYERLRGERAVYALDFPGFGFSERSEREYVPRLMTDAVHAVVAELRAAHGGAPVDALALSLSCEFLARAAVERPTDYRTLALVSPTGFSGATRGDGPPGAHRGIRPLHAVLAARPWARALFGALTRPGTIRYFLQRTYGSKRIDEDLLAYDVLTTHQPGAEHAPLYFVSAFLFSQDALRLYATLPHPVWMTHGVRGDFTDYRRAKDFASRPNWRIDVYDTGALPHFERADEFGRAYRAFLEAAPAP